MPDNYEKFDTISADDVIEVRSVEGVHFTEVHVALDTGEHLHTVLSAQQAKKLGEALLRHASGAAAARHTTTCRVEQVNNWAGDSFWVCGSGCPTLRS